MAVASPHLPTPGRQRRAVLGTVAGLVVFGVCGLVVLGLVSGSIGVGAVLVGAVCALVPVGPVVWAFLWVDRWEPEPPRTLLFAFLWGACVAALSALIINSSAVLVADAVLGQGSGDVLGASVIAPIVEEGVKGAFVVGLLIFRRREFDGIVDGIVYAGLVGAGFAFTENILYMGRAFAESGGLVGQDGGAARGAHPARGPLTVRAPAVHVDDRHRLRARRGQPHRRRPGCCTCWSDMRWRWCCTRCGTARPPSAAAKRSWGSTSSSWCRCSRHDRPGRLAAAARTAHRRGAAPGLRDGRLDRAERGGAAVDAGRRNRWRRAVRQRSGKDAEKAVTEYQTAVTELAFLRARMSRGAVGSHAWEWHDERLSALVAARGRAMGQPQALTAAWLRPPPSGWAPPPPQAPGWRPNPSPPPGWSAGPQGGGWSPPPGGGNWGPPRG